ncbi:hypothetical protein SCHPADRAFT_900549 [Schizopora paradoxa]|uniref:MYND-type domain-containing protein n=1 Tax=Schizopora paradoxa TaxID=27342 RepID=A0A0H2S7H9_9AGAM|nr:hypothetical protein SCHPADRAFT_900549 [Schizopora paradoxa]
MSENVPPWSSKITKKHITAARSGSEEDLEIIARHADAIPHQHALEAMELFYPSFNVPRGFNPSAPLPGSLHSRYKQVKHGIRALGRIGSRMASRGDLSFKTTFLSSWPNMLKWAHFYFLDFRFTSGPTYKSAMGTLSLLFVVFGAIEGSYTNAAFRDETLTLLAKIWLKVVPNTGSEEDNYEGGGFEITHQMRLALSDVALSPSWFLPSAREIILREAENQASAVAKVALTALRNAPTLRTDIVSQKFAYHSLFVVFALLHLDKPGDGLSVFHKAFIDQRVLRISTRILSHFSTSPNNAFEYSAMIAGSCFDIINAVLESKTAFILAPRILNYNFLDGSADYISSFCSSGKGPLDPNNSSLHNIIGRLYPSFFVHYPVISSAIHATNSLIRSKKMNKLSSSIVGTKWKIFMDLLLERATVKAHYDLTLRTKNHLVCHNCGSASGSSGKKVSACSGCKVALYCSSECQKEAWSSELVNHRLECNTLKELSLGSDKYFNLHSTQFWPNLVAYDMRRHLPGIRKLQAENPDFQNAGADLAYAITYTRNDKEPEKEISLFLRSNAGDGTKFRSAESAEISSAKFEHAIKKAEMLDSRNGQMVHVTLLRGGPRTDCVFMNLLKADFILPTNAVIGSPVGKSNVRRRKARDEQGREFETLWDIIDDTMHRALKEDEAAHRDISSSLGKEIQETIFDRIVRLAKERDDIERGITPLVGMVVSVSL